jgi:hypothetical protein
MQNGLVSSLIMLAGLAAFWAYTNKGSLIRDYKLVVTFIDLGAIFILGLITGVALGIAGVIIRRRSTQS